MMMERGKWVEEELEEVDEFLGVRDCTTHLQTS